MNFSVMLSTELQQTAIHYGDPVAKELRAYTKAARQVLLVGFRNDKSASDPFHLIMERKNEAEAAYRVTRCDLIAALEIEHTNRTESTV